MPRGGKRSGAGRPKVRIATRSVTLYLSVEGEQKLNAIAKAQKVPKGQVVEDFLKQYEVTIMDCLNLDLTEAEIEVIPHELSAVLCLDTQVTITFSDPGMHPTTVTCEPWEVAHELNLQVKRYTTAFIQAKGKTFTLRRFLGDEQWIPFELFMVLKSSIPDTTDML